MSAAVWGPDLAGLRAGRVRCQLAQKRFGTTRSPGPYGTDTLCQLTRWCSALGGANRKKPHCPWLLRCLVLLVNPGGGVRRCASPEKSSAGAQQRDAGWCLMTAALRVAPLGRGSTEAHLPEELL